MMKSTIAMLATAFLLLGCASSPGPTSLATLRAACDAGNKEACLAGGFHAQQPVDDVALAASIDVALNDALLETTKTAAISHRRYSSIQ
jgi:hypothetical protein